MATSPHSPKYVLSLDGGGVRGYAQVVFLTELVKRTGVPIHELFDCIAGTSIGAFIGAVYAYNTKLTAEEMKAKVFTLQNAQAMMQKDIFDKALPLLQWRPKYDGKAKRAVIDEFLPDVPMGDVPGGTAVCITAYDVSRGKAVFFKSYDEKDRKRDVSIRAAVDASSAGPFYFPSVEIKAVDGTRMEGGMECGVDGGMFANNPTDCVYADMLLFWHKETPINIVSIGTGMAPPRPVGNPEEIYVPLYRKILSCFCLAQAKPRRVVPGSATREWGGWQWLLQGNFVDRVFDASNSCVSYKTYLFARALGHNYIRVNVENPTWYIPSDDSSEENFNNMGTLGMKMWEQFGDQVVQMLQPRIDSYHLGKRKSVIKQSSFFGRPSSADVEIQEKDRAPSKE